MALSSEHRIVILLVKPKLQEEEEQELLSLLSTHMNWSSVIGLIVTHRVAGISYRRMEEIVHKYNYNEFAYNKIYAFLRDIYHVQYSRVLEQAQRSLEVADCFEKQNISYAVLKGLALSQGIYQDLGCRNFNDTDILVHPDQLQQALNALKDNGYTQGILDEVSGDIVPAKRRDVVIRPMVSHEVIPLQKKIDHNPFIKIQEIDLQFSLDLMTSNRTDSLVGAFLDRSIHIPLNNGRFNSLSWEDHFIFLCIHYYKEAVTDLEVKVYNDLSLYKLCDIAHLLESDSIDINLDLVIERARQYHMGAAVFFTLHFLREVFQMPVIEPYYAQLLPDDIQFIHQVHQYNKDELAYQWNDTVIERVFNMNRVQEFMKTSDDDLLSAYQTTNP